MENVNTYKHAKHVNQNHRRPPPLRYNTLLWPNQYHHGSPDIQYDPYSNGPPVRNPADLIALRFIQQHYPHALNINPEQLNIDEEAFERYEQRLEAHRRSLDHFDSPKIQKQRLAFQKKYATPHVSQFERECGVRPTPKPSQPKKSRPAKQKPKRSKFFDDLLPGTSNSWDVPSTSSETPELCVAEIIEQEFEVVEEFLCEATPIHFIVESIQIPQLSFPVVNDVPQFMCASCTVVEDFTDPQDIGSDSDVADLRPISTLQEIRNGRLDFESVFVSPRVRGNLWKSSSHGLMPWCVAKYHRRHFSCAMKGGARSATFRFLSVARNFKKRRRRCKQTRMLEGHT